MTLPFGMFFGLMAATCFSFAYLGSRLFYEKAGTKPLLLLALAFIQMGLFSCILLPAVWSPFPFSVELLLPLLGATLLGMGGQLTFFFTLKSSTPSQLAPLLALKIFILAFASIVFLQKEISALQWLSIFFCFAATFLINFSGKPIPLRGFIGILVTCCCYALGDVSVAMLIQQLDSLSAGHPALLAVCLVYGLSGIFGLILGGIMWRDLRRLSPWKSALYFSFSFFLADVCLFTTFKLVGPVFGNILQSTRGIISILLAKFIAQKGMHYLEHETNRNVLFRRLLAAGLFSLAIALYVLGE